MEDGNCMASGSGRTQIKVEPIKAVSERKAETKYWLEGKNNPPPPKMRRFNRARGEKKRKQDQEHVRNCCEPEVREMKYYEFPCNLV